MSNEKRLWIIEARDGEWGANGICKGELVRCKDCKHNIGEKVWLDGDVTIDCDNGMGYPQPDWFCADGERKDGSV